jgi:dolichol-phosphate mannosyltransferase
MARTFHRDDPHETPPPRRRRRRERPTLSVVVPLLDESEGLPALHARLRSVLDGLGLSHEILYVDDGSRDATPSLLADLAARDPAVAVLTLSRNFGHQAAVSAGLDRATGRAVVVMDGDGQDPPELIPDLLDRWRAGFDVVYAVRRARKEGALKRLGYAAFYRLLRNVGEIEIPADSGDFGLMDRKVVAALASLPERTRFVRGLRSYVGFRQVGLEYDRPARQAGRPKYTLRKLAGLALDGLVSFSSAPLRLVTRLGLASATLALGLLAWVLHDAFVHRTAPRGWASTVVVVLFMGAVQLVSLGIIGEYVRLIFAESKRRPTYVVASYRRAGRPGRSRVGEARR